MFQEFEELIKTHNNSKESLLKILIKYSKTISVFDQMKVISELKNGLKLIQKNYREDFFEAYAKYFVVRVNDIKNEKIEEYDNQSFDLDEFTKSVVMLENQDKEQAEESSKEFRKIYDIIALYTTFILNEPIHAVGTRFPGNLEIIEKDGKYYCPVKKNNEDNPKAVCQFCIALNLDYD